MLFGKAQCKHYLLYLLYFEGGKATQRTLLTFVISVQRKKNIQ